MTQEIDKIRMAYAEGVISGKADAMRLYQAVNEMMARLGAEGTITTIHGEVAEVMDALYCFDGGVPIQPPVDNAHVADGCERFGE